jgi:hypothetical protein
MIEIERGLPQTWHHQTRHQFYCTRQRPTAQTQHKNESFVNVFHNPLVQQRVITMSDEESKSAEDKVLDEITYALTLADLDIIEERVQRDTGFTPIFTRTVTALLRSQKNSLTLRAQTQIEKAQKEGTYFEDVKCFYTLKPAEKSNLDKSFNRIFRKTTPTMYSHITEAAKQVDANQSLRSICDKSLGSNSEYPKGKVDLFGKSIDPSRAHVFLDSPSCAPAWGYMTEGATGLIPEGPERNRIRVLRMMGGGQKEEGKNMDCLRYDVHNYIPLHNEHRVYFHEKPQLMIIPILGLEKIVHWSYNDKPAPYDVLVFVHSPHEMTKGLDCNQIYTTLLSSY